MASDPANPAPHLDARSWGELLAAMDQDAMIAWLGSSMGPDLRRSTAPEDVWQETLAMAWRDRQSHEWRGPAAFRAWLRGIATHRLQDHAKRVGAKKRGGGRRIQNLTEDSQGIGPGFLPVASTTPSRQAGRHERARVLQESLESLPDEYRDLVRMCLFEEQSVPAAAALLGIADSTAYRRLLRGAELFRSRVRERMGSTSSDHRGAS